MSLVYSVEALFPKEFNDIGKKINLIHYIFILNYEEFSYKQKTPNLSSSENNPFFATLRTDYIIETFNAGV